MIAPVIVVDGITVCYVPGGVGDFDGMAATVLDCGGAYLSGVKIHCEDVVFLSRKREIVAMVCHGPDGTACGISTL